MHIGVDNDHLIRRNNELSTILDVSMVLISSFEGENNLSKVMKILSKRLEMQRGCLFLLDRDSGDIKITAAHGLTPEEIKKGKYRIGEGIVGRVMESDNEMFIPDIGDEPQFLNRTGSRISREGISYISIPIRMKGETFGVLSVDRLYSNESGSVEDDVRVLKIVSSLIAQYLKLWEIYKKSKREKDRLEIELKDRYNLPNIVGISKPLQSVLKSVVKVARTDATVLLLGESGTGKELIARTLHFQSARAEYPYIAVNCAALPSNLIESELFGVEKGAYTGATARRLGRFELAKDGTIFLDEIGELPVDVQAKLLRVLQEKTFERVGSSIPIKADVRVITATNRNLEEEIERGAFREDLYWRLNVVPIMLPSLRERPEDVEPLVDHYIEHFSSGYGSEVSITDDAMEVLKSYSWPGNVRELANMVERLVIMSEGEPIKVEDLPRNVLRRKNSDLRTDCSSTLCSEVAHMELERITDALRVNGNNQQKTARELGITPRQLGYRIKKYKIKL